MKSYQDHELVHLAKQEVTAAYEQLVRRYYPLLTHWLKSFVADTDMAADIAQETFITAWEKIDTLRNDDTFKSWLFSIAYRSFLQHVRKTRQQRRLLTRLDDCPDTNNGEPDGSAIPEIQRLLSMLGTESRNCMLLSYSYEFSHGEIAKILDLPLGTVKSNIKRSIETIRRKFRIRNEDV